jgi:hypothetical protein
VEIDSGWELLQKAGVEPQAGKVPRIRSG